MPALCDIPVSFVFWSLNSPQENVVDLLPDEGPQSEELSIDPMQDGLQEVPLPRVLAVEQLQQLQGQTHTHILSIQSWFKGKGMSLLSLHPA